MINEEKRQEEQENFNDRLDILKHISDIKLKLKEDITNDFVLAKLGDKDKEAIIEMTGNAYFSKRLLDVLAEKSYEWKWSEKESKYLKVKIEKEQKQTIKKMARALFDSYMIKIYMTVVLNRNVDKNYLINVLSGYIDKDNEGTEVNTEEQVKSAVANLLADQEKKEK